VNQSLSSYLCEKEEEINNRGQSLAIMPIRKKKYQYDKNLKSQVQKNISISVRENIVLCLISQPDKFKNFQY
jgi:hypothetical protein